MPTCGYVCPKCEGRGFDEQLDPCTWCTMATQTANISDEEWLASTHEGCGCSNKNNINEIT
jgi:hypothetical protein